MIRAYAFTFLKEAVLGIFWVYWAATLIWNGETLSRASLYLGLFYFCWAISEVPTGLFADRFGRKLSSLIGAILLLVGFACNLSPSSRHLTFLAFPLCAIGLTCISGASIAWLSENAETRSDMSASDFIFNSQILGRIAVIIASIGGSLVFSISSTTLWSLACILVTTMIIVGLTIPECPRDATTSGTGTLWSEASGAFRSPVVPFLFFGILGYGFEMGVRNMTWTPYLLDLKSGDTKWIGIFNATLAGIRLVGLIVYRQWTRSKRSNSDEHAFPLVIMGVLALSLAEVNAVFARSYWAFILPYGTAMVFLGWYFAYRDILVIRTVAPKVHATALSVFSFGESFAAAMACFLLALIWDFVGPHKSWGIGAVGLMVSGIMYAIGNHANAQQMNQSTARVPG